MALIVAYDISNICQVASKKLHMGFVYVTSKREETHTWFLETLRGVVCQFTDETVELAEAMITRGIDRAMSVIKRADKKKKLPDVLFSYQSIGHWFNILDFSLTLADALMYPCACIQM
ncbi:hypothetical protein BDB01DRAFT_795348 [Pilobolus umbonatus]|nr:hypothetical protein BDB01DRAFT_795348 [Pilobolus umbonatus]